MQEILTVATYLVVWFFCDLVLKIENGLINLLVSLGAALGVYIFVGVKEHQAKKKRGEE